MADNFLSSIAAIENQQSFYNVIKKTGWEDAPFFSSISSTSFNGKDPALGHTWFYRKRPTGSATNAYAEGSKRADVESYIATKLQNELQILKKTYGVTKSQKTVMSVEGKANYLAEQSAMSAIDLRLSVEKALLLNTAPVSAATIADVRKLGGISHYLIVDTVADDGAGNPAPLDWSVHVKNSLKAMWLNGCKANYIMTSAAQKDALDVILDTKKQYSRGDTSYVDNFSMIADTGYAKNVKIMVNPFLADDEMYFYDSRLVRAVLHRAEKSDDVTDKTFDSEAYQHLFELTLQIDDPYAMVRVSNLAV